MLVISMNSKRQRRPNVRLGEIGDMPAAFACVFSHKARDDLGYDEWKLNMEDPEESERADSSGFSKQKTPDCLKSSSVVSMNTSGDSQQNGENKDPSSPRSAFDFTNADEMQMGLMAKTNLDFGTVTRKSRVMKRRARGKEWNSGVFTGTWSWKSRVCAPKYKNEDGNAHNGKNISGNTHSDNEFEEYADRDALATSKEPCEFDSDERRCSSSSLQRDADDYWQDGVCLEVDNTCAKSNDDYELVQMRDVDADANSVKGWLEGHGFGRYAGVFQIHEVDKETLPLLTLEDLKDMGIIAVGHRRKLYTALQQLRDVST